MVIDHSSKILQLVQIKGPIIPSDISKQIGTDILTASAILSEMVSKNQLRISSVKIGGSPLYYLSGQEEMLQKFADRLHEKERQVYELLREKRVLRDIQLDPVSRVALRQIKDFAKPLEVNFGDRRELFWKWFLIPSLEVEPLIRAELEGIEPKAEAPVEPPKEAVVAVIEKQKQLVEPQPVPKLKKPRVVEDRFLEQVQKYFETNGIEVEEVNVIKKNSEADFLITIPSAIGRLKYYCKASNKKRYDESSLSSVFAQGQLKRRPTIFFISGQLTKKAQELYTKEFNNIIIKRL